jgi:hypothetical protein
VSSSEQHKARFTDSDISGFEEAAMAHPYRHCLSSMRKWGGAVSDYLHTLFDQSKAIAGDFRHRALGHHVNDRGARHPHRDFGGFGRALRRPAIGRVIVAGTLPGHQSPPYPLSS